MNKAPLLAAALGLVITTAAVSITTYAAPFSHLYKAEKFSAVNEALTNNDYAAWVGAVGNHGRFGENITEENFDQFAEMHRLMQAGDVEGAGAIAEQLGLPTQPGVRMMFRGPDSEEHAAVQAALEAGDYEAWQTATGELCRFGENITEENFDQFAEMHRLMQAGDVEGAQTIAEQLGIEPMGKGLGPKMFWHGMPNFESAPATQ